MKVLDIINEGFQYKKYIPAITDIINNSFHKAYKSKGYNLEGKVNDFLHRITVQIDEQVLAPILQEHPLEINSIPIKTLSLSFTKPYDISESIESIDFFPEALFKFDADVKQVFIEVEADYKMIGYYLFKQDNPKDLTKSIKRITSNLVGILMHEVRHHVQKYKVSKKQGSHVQSHLLNKFYTGDPRSDEFNKNKEYQTAAGYFLNAFEIDAWAASIASDISNKFGNNVDVINQYLNNASKGVATNSADGQPIHTTLDSYYQKLFDPKTRTNTDKNIIWRRIIKKVYKDLQQHQNPA